MPTLSHRVQHNHIRPLPRRRRQLWRAVGITQFPPYANFPQNQTVRQALLPFPQYTGAMAPLGAPLGKSWYDALQLTFTKRFSHGLTANANYTYSKTSGSDHSPLTPSTGIWARTSAPMTFRTSSGSAPSTRYRAFPPVSSATKCSAYIVSGWGTGWYLNYQSAALVGLPTSSGTAPISNFLGYGPGPAQLIPGVSPWSVDWIDKSGTHHTDPLDINCHCFDVTKTQVLNPAAFTNVPDGQFAANQSSIRSFRGIRYPSENANFSRNFRIKERYVLQIRAEFTNIFNRVQYPFPRGLSLPD